MKQVLQIFTFQRGYMGGIANIVKSYFDGQEVFTENSCYLNNLNVAPNIHTGYSKIDNFAYIFYQRSEVRKHLRFNKYDIIHIHTSREYLFLKDIFLAKMIKREFHTPVFLTIHVGSIETVFNRIGGVEKMCLNILNKYVSKTVFLSRVMQQDFIRKGLIAEKTAVLYNFHNLTPTVRDVKPMDCLQLLFVGAIHREKGILELLRALDSLKEKKFHLNICGKLTDKSIEQEVKVLKKNLGSKVSFLGYVTGEDKTLLYRQADILILPSYHEGLPLVIMEALSEGCAIITTKVGAIPEILCDENCFWVDVASTESIVRSINMLDKEKIIRQKELNRNLGLSYTFVSHVKKLCKLYNNSAL